MGLVYLTGSSGVGKTTVGGELRRRGYLVYDVDVDGLARWFENASGVEVGMPADRDDAWFAEYTYRLPVETVRRIAAEVGDGVGFVCGTVGNDGGDLGAVRRGGQSERRRWDAAAAAGREAGGVRGGRG
jgi:hypothetical protein